MSLCEALLEASGQFCENGNCGDAIESLRNAVRLDPNNPAILYRLGACLSGKCRPHRFMDLEEAARWLRAALEHCGPDTPPLFLASLLETLGGVCLQTWPASLDEALRHYQQASLIYASERQMESWARVEFNLGNATCELSEPSHPRKWRDAAMHFRNALRFRTRDRNPLAWAATQQNLGTALRALGRTAEAFACFRRALRVYSAEAYPRQHASLRINLANVYLSLAGGRGRKICRALDHLDRVLEVPADLPYEKAVAHFHRAQLIRHRLPHADPAAALEEYRLAEEMFSACGRHDMAQLVREAAVSAAKPASVDRRPADPL